MRCSPCHSGKCQKKSARTLALPSRYGTPADIKLIRLNKNTVINADAIASIERSERNEFAGFILNIKMVNGEVFPFHGTEAEDLNAKLQIEIGLHSYDA